MVLTLVEPVWNFDLTLSSSIFSQKHFTNNLDTKEIFTEPTLGLKILMRQCHEVANSYATIWEPKTEVNPNFK